MVYNSEKKMVVEMLRTVADGIDQMADWPTEIECKRSIYDIFIVMKFIDEWWK